MTDREPATAACEWCGRAIKQDAEGRWYAVKGEERGYDPLVCEATGQGHTSDQPAPRRTFWDATCWRTGRKVGRTIYAQLDAEPSDDDPLIGVMDTPELAALVVEAVNATR